MVHFIKVFYLLFLLFTQTVVAQSNPEKGIDTLDLLEEEDAQVLIDEAQKDEIVDTVEKQPVIDVKTGRVLEKLRVEEKEDLELLKKDAGEELFIDKVNPQEGQVSERPEDILESGAPSSQIKAVNDLTPEFEGPNYDDFNLGDEEKKLLEVAKFFEGKIPESEWNEIAMKSQVGKYTISSGDTLWDISNKLFGSGFYYSKVWSLNPYITNPHEIKPGMVLVFDTGDSNRMPEIQVGGFQNSTTELLGENFDFANYGQNAKPPWLEERQKLINSGVYFQFASRETYKDLAKLEKKSLTKEYEKYEVPPDNIIIPEPSEKYDEVGFDQSSKVKFDFKEGFYLNTFVTTNIVQDLGVIDSIQKGSLFISNFDRVYAEFDEGVNVKPGDMFSAYAPEGKVTHELSNRQGYRYTIVAQLKALQKKNHLWECIVTEVTGLLQRGQRLTIYTPKVNRIVKHFNTRRVEAVIVDSYRETGNGLSYGDVVYLDRGRADGVEMGTIFEVYSFTDRGTGKKITRDPTYKIAEITVITLTDNFATGLISMSHDIVNIGSLALTKSKEDAAMAYKLRNKEKWKHLKKASDQALEELDVELHLDDVSEDLLKKAESIRLTPTEVEELDRQERENSTMKEHEKDLRELEKLESEIVQAEERLNERKVDEDKFLEQRNLDEIEKNAKGFNPNAFESVNDIEKDIGKKYLDESLNEKDNPYGITETDIEDLDQLFNTKSQIDQAQAPFDDSFEQ